MSQVQTIKVNTNKVDENGFRFSSIRVFGYGQVSDSAFPAGETAKQKTRGFEVTTRDARKLGLSGSLQIRCRHETIEIVVSKIRDVDGVRIIRQFSHNSITNKIWCYEYRSDVLIGDGQTYKFIKLIGETRVATHEQKHGFVVGVVSRENVPFADCNFASLRQFAENNNASKFGYWRDENGKVSFDVVKTFSVDQFQLAVQTALQCNQVAIFDYSTGQPVKLDDIQTGETEQNNKIYRAYSYNGETFELCSELADKNGNELTLSNVG